MIDALMMAVWKRKPKERVIVHSDQGSQYGSGDWLCLHRFFGFVTSGPFGVPLRKGKTPERHQAFAA